MKRLAQVVMVLTGLAGCGAPPSTDEVAPKHDPFASPYARLLTFAFEGEAVVGYRVFDARALVQQQLLYTIGQLNGSGAVGRLDAVTLTMLEPRIGGDGLTYVRYAALLPVGWSHAGTPPRSYTLQLPRRLDRLAELAAAHGKTCVDAAAHDVDAGNFWYYYRPELPSCRLGDDELGRFSAVVAVSDENTSGRYPELDRIFEDGVLDVVAIFGKYEDGATSNADAGIAAYNEFAELARVSMGSGVVTTPAHVKAQPGVAQPDITFTREVNGVRTRITALLVDNVRVASPELDVRYAALSTEADLIVYSGHAGLGSNVRALAGKGAFRPGKYQIFFMNGCDTFAYVDGALAAQRARLNADDPRGTKYLDIVTNVMPAYFHAMAADVMVMIRGLSDPEKPLTYEQLFRGIDPQQVVVVTGEEDNAFSPTRDEAVPWRGLSEAGALAHDEELRFSTPTLLPGTYIFALEPADAEEQDADLYVRVGVAPTLTDYDCRPYDVTSRESCTMTLGVAAPVHLMVRGYSERAAFTLSGRLK